MYDGVVLSKHLARQLIKYRSGLRALLRKLLNRFAISVVIPRGVKKFTAPNDAKIAGPLKVCFIGVGEVGSFLPHRIVSAHLESIGGVAEFGTPSLISKAYSRAWKADLTGPGRRFGTFRELVDFMVSEFGEDFHFGRGVIDEYLRRVPRNFLIDTFRVPDSYLKMAHNVRLDAEKFVAHYDSLVLHDSAYLPKRSLLAAASRQDKPVWILSSGGLWLKVDGSKDDHSAESFISRAEHQIMEHPEIFAVASKYLEDRMGGQVKGDLDAPFVYGRAETSNQPEAARKVLFLHAIRDANGLPFFEDGSRSLFVTYLEWAVEALKLVAEEPDQWWIKPHPQKFLFPDEPRIIRELADKFGVPHEIIRPELDTRLVLRNKFPVYTHSGTIAYEAAAHGYKAHVASSSIPDRIAKVSRNLSEMEADFRCAFDVASSPIASELDIDFARALLYLRFRRPAIDLAPQGLRRTVASKSNWELNDRADVVDLISRYSKSKAHETARVLAQEIAETAGQFQG